MNILNFAGNRIEHDSTVKVLLRVQPGDEISSTLWLWPTTAVRSSSLDSEGNTVIAIEGSNSTTHKNDKSGEFKQTGIIEYFLDDAGVPMQDTAEIEFYMSAPYNEALYATDNVKLFVSRRFRFDSTGTLEVWFKTKTVCERALRK